MRSVRSTLSLALLSALLLPGVAHADRPGRHAHYLHALSDLRAVQDALEHPRRGAEPEWFERKALDELDAAVDGLEEAAFRVGKDVYELPPVDVRTRARGRLPTVLALLRRAYDDAAEDEDDGRARALRRRALSHVDRAIQLVEDGMEGREPAPPPPDESVSQDDWEEGAPAEEEEEEEALYEDAPDPGARAVYLEPPVEAPPPVAVRYLPPPMRYEPPPPIPEEGMYWVGGYWVWDDGEWVWMSGHWVRPPRPEYLWVAPYYEVRGPVVVFVTGHWGPPGYVFRPPPPAVQIRVVEARPAYRGTLVVGARVTVGSFVPAPPGSRLGIIVPAPVGTPPQVVVGAPPVVRPGMVVRPVENRTTVIRNTTVINNVTIVAPAGCTKSGQPVRAIVPGRPALAASLPPRAAVAPPPPPPSAVHAHPGFFSPVAVRPPQPGQRQPLPPTVTPHPTDNTLRVRPGRTERAPFGHPQPDRPGAGNPPPGNPPPAAGQPAPPPPGADDRHDRPRGPRGGWFHDDGRQDDRREEDRPRNDPARTEPGHPASPGNAAQPPPPGDDRRDRDDRGPREGWRHDGWRRDDAGPRTDPARTEPGRAVPPANNPPPAPPNAQPAQPPQPPPHAGGGPGRHEPQGGEAPRSDAQHPATAPARTEQQRPGGAQHEERSTNAPPPPRQEPQHAAPPPQSPPPAQPSASQPSAARPQGGGAPPAPGGPGHHRESGKGGDAPRGRPERPEREGDRERK